MPALDPETRARWRGLVVVDRDAATVGTITVFYLDRTTGLPTWALVILSAYYGLDDHRGAVADRPLGPEPAVTGAAGMSTASAEPARQPTRAGPSGPPVPRLAGQGPVEVVRSEVELQVGVRRRRLRLRLRLRLRK